MRYYLAGCAPSHRKKLCYSSSAIPGRSHLYQVVLIYARSSSFIPAWSRPGCDRLSHRPQTSTVQSRSFHDAWMVQHPGISGLATLRHELLRLFFTSSPKATESYFLLYRCLCCQVWSASDESLLRRGYINMWQHFTITASKQTRWNGLRRNCDRKANGVNSATAICRLIEMNNLFHFSKYTQYVLSGDLFQFFVRPSAIT